MQTKEVVIHLGWSIATAIMIVLITGLIIFFVVSYNRASTTVSEIFPTPVNYSVSTTPSTSGISNIINLLANKHLLYLFNHTNLLGPAIDCIAREDFTPSQCFELVLSTHGRNTLF